MSKGLSSIALLLTALVSAALPALERQIRLTLVDGYGWEHVRHQGLRHSAGAESIISSLWPGVDHRLRPVQQPTNPWPNLREQLAPELMASDLLDAPRRLDLSTDGWEDGLTVSRDGLHLYAIYAPGDLLGYTLDGYPFQLTAQYLRGPTLGMNLDASEGIGVNTWLHGDILRSSRASVSEPFPPWTRSDLAFPVTSEGAPALFGGDGSGWELMVYTSNQTPPHYSARIWLTRNQNHSLSQVGEALAEPINPPPAEADAAWQTDNPHLERLSDDSLVLFYDSDRPGGPSTGLDIWYSRSFDDGISWQSPLPVNSVNTTATEHQPHLWQDSDGQWWLWWSATNPLDGRLAIYRARQQVAGNWDSWSTRELIIGAGSAAGIGEPTLTAAGDLYFIVVIEDPNPGPGGRFMADPWYAAALPSAPPQENN